MSSGCGDVLSLEDLKTAKKHQTFEAEVITGRAGGVASGSEIDYATNQVTGQVQKTMPAILRDMGFDPASFDFTTGGTVTERDTVVYNPADNNWYSWSGSLPHVIAPGTDPTADANWKPRTDQLLRQNLATNAAGQGADLVAAPLSGTVRDYLQEFTTIEAFLSAAGGNIDDALDMAVAYCASSDCNVIKLASGANYDILRAHDWSTIDNITIRGDRSGVFQNGSVSYGPATPVSPSNPTESAFLWKGPNATTWFNVGSQFTFDGIVFSAPNQNFAATTPAGLVDTGTTINAKTNLNVISCVYFGMKNFAVGTGQTQVFRDNIGSAYECDYQIINSRDINQIINCHSNPNVFRASVDYVKATISNRSIFVKLNNHDGTHITNCMTFGKKIAVKNYADTNYLGNLTLNTITNDFIGTIVDTQTEGGGFVSVSNVMAVGGSASDSGTTPDADAGFFVLRKTNVSQIATVDISNTYCNLAANPFTSLPPYLINFQVAEAYAVNLNAVECTRPTDNGAGVFCTINGNVTAAANTHTADPIRENIIPNGAWTWRHPSNSVPMGWSLVNATVETNISRRVTATATGGYISTSWRQDTTGRTVIVTATSVGSSAGITVIGTDAGGVSTQYDYPWVRRGGKYYATGYISSAARTHELRIYAGNNGSSVVVENAAMVPGSIVSYGDSYSNRPPKSTTTGLSSYGISLAAGASHAIYPDYAGKSGAYHVYISSALGSYIARIVKIGPTSAATITVEDQVYGGANTFTVTWPADSTPVVTTSAAGLLFITLVGATYTPAL